MFRVVMLVLVFNLSQLPGHLRAQVRTPVPPNRLQACSGPAELITVQRGLSDRLGWSGYSWCEAWATTDRDVPAFEPDANDPNTPGSGPIVTGTSGDQPFVLAVKHFRLPTDWAGLFPDDPNLATTAGAMNTHARTGVGVMSAAVQPSGHRTTLLNEPARVTRSLRLSDTAAAFRASIKSLRAPLGPRGRREESSDVFPVGKVQGWAIDTGDSSER